METDEKTQLAITVNNRHFVVAINEIVKIVYDKSNTIDLTQIDTKNKKNAKIVINHMRLRTSCEQIQNGIKLLDNEPTKNDFDTGGVIKKIYKTLTKNFSKLYPEPNLSLFELLNDHGERITVIPGLDINLVSKLFTQEELKLFWGYIYMMFISVVNLISIFNNHKEKGDVWDAMTNMKLYIAKSGILKDGKFFNPFLGITKDKDGEYGITELYKNVNKLENSPGFGMKEFLQMSGVESLIKPDQLKDLNDQLKNISQEDVDSSINHVLNFMGATDNPDIKEVCTALTKEIVSDIQSRGELGLSSMIETAQSVVQKMGNKLDRNKMMKTAKQLSNCMQNGESTLKNMKDEKGNPIGLDIFNKLSMPLGLLKKMEEYSGNSVPEYPKEREKDTNSTGSQKNNKKLKDTDSTGSQKNNNNKKLNDNDSMGSQKNNKK